MREGERESTRARDPRIEKVCVLVLKCVCVCEREREKGRERVTKKTFNTNIGKRKKCEV